VNLWTRNKQVEAKKEIEKVKGKGYKNNPDQKGRK